MGSPIPACFLLICRSTLQCLVGDNSLQVGQIHFVLIISNSAPVSHWCDTGVTPEFIPELAKYRRILCL